MEEHRGVLKKAGTVLMVVGIIDIAIMAYCIANRISYSSSFNIFAVVAGILLYRGGLTTARVVAWFAAFMFVSFATLLVLFPFIEPVGLLITKFKLNPGGMLISAAFMSAVLGLLIWLYRQLTNHAVVEARREAGLSVSKPKVAYALGALLPICLGLVMYMANHGESGQRIKAKAKEVYGDAYEYHINSMNWAKGGVSAQLSAFNDHEIFSLFVACEQEQTITGAIGCSIRSLR